MSAALRGWTYVAIYMGGQVGNVHTLPVVT